GIEWRFRVDHDVFPSWKLNDDIGTDSSVFRWDGLLIGEMAVLHHACELDDALQLQLAPPPPDARTFQRVHQARRLHLKVLSHEIERGNSFNQLGARFNAPALRFLDF